MKMRDIAALAADKNEMQESVGGENEKRLFFIGHREAPATVRPLLDEAVERYILQRGVREFVVGQRGEFDRMAADAVRAAKLRHAGIRLVLLLAYHPVQGAALPAGFDSSVYPFEEAVLPRVAIVRANRKMVDQCDFVLACVSHPGNARAVMEYALRRQERGLVRVENLTDTGSRAGRG